LAVQVVAVDNAKDLSLMVERGKPRGILSLLGDAPIHVQCTIGPPHRTTLTEGGLCSIDLALSLLAPALIASSLRDTFGAPRSHQQGGQAISLSIGELRVAAAPWTPTNHEVATVRSG
jgi:hypothetical protein